LPGFQPDGDPVGFENAASQRLKNGHLTPARVLRASLAAVRKAAESEGYEVRGLAPTSCAAQKLAESGIESETLQRHLRREERVESGQKRLYVLDESSLASTKQMNEFLHRLQGEDRVLLVGDTR
jgi:ATP-dependent exoDNAse (exonuclease V) alpha subunit